MPTVASFRATFYNLVSNMVHTTYEIEADDENQAKTAAYQRFAADTGYSPSAFRLCIENTGLSTGTTTQPALLVNTEA